MRLIALALILPVALLVAAPVVSNVAATPRLGTGIVDIYYDLSSSAACEVTVEVSNDGGATFGIKAGIGLTGDVGTGVAHGTGKHITWDVTSDHETLKGDNFLCRVTADDGRTGAPEGMEALGNSEYRWRKDGSVMLFIANEPTGLNELLHAALAVPSDSLRLGGVYPDFRSNARRRLSDESRFSLAIPTESDQNGILTGGGISDWIDGRDPSCTLSLSTILPTFSGRLPLPSAVVAATVSRSLNDISPLTSSSFPNRVQRIGASAFFEAPQSSKFIVSGQYSGDAMQTSINNRPLIVTAEEQFLGTFGWQQDWNERLRSFACLGYTRSSDGLMYYMPGETLSSQDLTTETGALIAIVGNTGWMLGAAPLELGGGLEGALPTVRHHPAIASSAFSETLAAGTGGDLFAYANVSPFTGFAIRPGLRLDQYRESTVSPLLLSPSLALTYKKSPVGQIEMSYRHYPQFVTALYPQIRQDRSLFYWMRLSDGQPTLVDQFDAVGTAALGQSLRLSGHAFYKWLANVNEMSDNGYSPASSSPGTVRGADLSVALSAGRFQFTGSYSFAAAELPGLVDTQSRCVQHAVGLQGRYTWPALGPGDLSMACTGDFLSGSPHASVLGYDLARDSGNTLRRPDYLRLDVATDYTLRLGSLGLSIGLGVANLTDPFAGTNLMYYYRDPASPELIREQLLLPLTPFLRAGLVYLGENE